VYGSVAGSEGLCVAAPGLALPVEPVLALVAEALGEDAAPPALVVWVAAVDPPAAPELAAGRDPDVEAGPCTMIVAFMYGCTTQ
jgi:hypothetical protein